MNRLSDKCKAALPRPEAEIMIQRASEVMRMPGEGILTRPAELEPAPVKPLLSQVLNRYRLLLSNSSYVIQEHAYTDKGGKL